MEKLEVNLTSIGDPLPLAMETGSVTNGKRRH